MQALNCLSSNNFSFKHILATLMVCLIAFSHGLLAADWQGVYAGPNVVHLKLDYSVNGPENDPGFGPNNPFDQTGGTTYSLTPEQTSAGLQLGYNHQFDRLLLGIEAEFSALDAKERLDVQAVNDYADISFRSPVTVSGRLGYSFGSWLPYIKGGISRAILEVSAGDFSVPRGIPDPSDRTDIREKDTGWIYGFGLEYRLHEHWSLKAEYNRLEFDDFRSFNLDGNGEVFIHDFDEIELFKLGFNYLF